MDAISMASNVTDVSGYQYQPKYRKKIQRKFVTGKYLLDTASSGSSFKGAPAPDRQLFIYRVQSDVSVDDVSKYLIEREITVKDLKCISNSNAKFRSFKLTVPIAEFKSLYCIFRGDNVSFFWVI